MVATPTATGHPRSVPRAGAAMGAAAPAEGAAAAAAAATTVAGTTKTSVRKPPELGQAAWAYMAKSLTYLLGWSLVSGLIIILNNWIMHYGGFPFPITLSASGPLFSWCVAATLVLTGHTKLERQGPDLKMHFQLNF